MAKVYVVLENSAGAELDRAEINIPPGSADTDAEDGEWNDAIQDTIRDWALSIGDTIRVVRQ